MSNNEKELTFQEVMEEANRNAHDKGFWDRAIPVPEFLCQVHGEVSEALEADRRGHHATNLDIDAAMNRINDVKMFNTLFERDIKNSFGDEMADSILRILDNCKERGIPIQDHLRMKMAYNRTRPRMHGKKY